MHVRRHTRSRTLLALFPILCVAWLGAGCGAAAPSPDATLNTFLSAFSRGDAAAAAATTDNAAAAKPLLDEVRNALKPVSMSAKLDGQIRSSGSGATSASATYTVTWDFGPNRTWTYQATTNMALDKNNTWHLNWAPSIINPQLAAHETIALRQQLPTPAPVLDSSGTPLMSPQILVSVMLDPKQAGNLTATAGTLASALAPFNGAITQQSIVDGANKTPSGQAYQVGAIPDSAYQQVKGQIYSVPGVSFQSQTKLLPTSPLASAIMPGIAKVADSQLAAAAGMRVVTVNQAGAEVATLYQTPATPVQPLTTTISTKVQQAAEAALASPVVQPGLQAMIVAIDPSNGHILAVAQNAAANAQGPLALVGQYPPGSTFKTVTGVAAMEANTVNMNTPTQCVGTVNVNGYPVINEAVGNPPKPFDLGTISLLNAYAQSCNTVFGPLAASLPASALTNAAMQLGVGIDFVIPGATTITGSAPATTDPARRAMEGFGQGPALASPFGLAMMAATVANGTMPTPTLIPSMQTKVNGTAAPIPQTVLDQMRQMMHAVCTSGTASALKNVPGCGGKTGTAQFGDGVNSHGWFIGYTPNPNLAFATLIVNGGSSTPAVYLTQAFLHNLGVPGA